MYKYTHILKRKQSTREKEKNKKKFEESKQKQAIKEEQIMDTQNIQTENQAEAAVSTTSCSKYVKDENATFLENLKGQFDEFINASMEEHKTCFKNTMDKIYEEVSKAVSAVTNVEVKEVNQTADST